MPFATQLSVLVPVEPELQDTRVIRDNNVHRAVPDILEPLRGGTVQPLHIKQLLGIFRGVIDGLLAGMSKRADLNGLAGKEVPDLILGRFTSTTGGQTEQSRQDESAECGFHDVTASVRYRHQHGW